MGRMTSFKAELTDGAVVPGLFVMEFASNGIGRIAAAAGARFVVFDTEHTGWTAETISRLVATTRPTGVASIVRVPATQSWFFAHALDAGAAGVMVPAVSSAAEARAVVAACRYPPEGRRGAAFGFAHDDYRGHDAVTTMRNANQETVVIAQIETRDGVHNADEIAATDGVDVLWVGHNDLTAALGIPGQFDHPDYVAALEQVTTACQHHHKAAGFNAGSIEVATAMLGRGFRCLAYGDIRLFVQALGDGIDALSRHDTRA